jgi:uncharacterized protein YceK
VLRRLALGIAVLALAGCGSISPYSGSNDDVGVVSVPARACTTVTTTTGYLIYRC